MSGDWLAILLAACCPAFVVIVMTIGMLIEKAINRRRALKDHDFHTWEKNTTP
jgi:hypothetical protein